MATTRTTGLPAPRTQSDVSVEDVIARRRSVRRFTPDDLTPEDLGQLLWAAQGITDPSGRRTAPSAGALGPLELYVVTREGVHQYVPDGHRLEARGKGDRRRALASAAADQTFVGDAPVVVVVTGILARTAWKFGGDRAWRYVNLEAGHAAQNLMLQATALGLGGVTVGAFDDNAVMDLLGLPADHRPLYLLPIGHPAQDDGS